MARKNAEPGNGVGLPIGQKIGKYEVVDRLGSGGQATVYKGYDLLLDRYVAIKQISSHLAEDPRFLQRFRREAQILARLGSEQSAIVTIHELLQDERGLFIVMEFVPGHSLETMLTETDGPMDVKTAMQIIWRLAGALHAVHSAGIIHRDIKPANIIIGEGLRPMITDFGVAASLSGQTSMLLGTTKYMAPELFASGDIDGRADMYSLGMIAYEMLIGRAKFNEVFTEIIRDPRSEALRWMKWHGNEQVAAPALHTVSPLVPQALSDVIAKMMAKDINERYKDTAALGSALKRSVAARPAPSKRRKVSRHVQPDQQGPALAGNLPPDEETVETRYEPLDTAPLPKRRMELRTKLILAGAGLMTLLVVVIALVVQEHKSTSAHHRRAKELYETALEQYNNEKYSEAFVGFDKLRTRFRGLEYADRASIWAPLCQARIALVQGDWSTAAAMEREAEKAVMDVQGKYDQATYPKLLGWTRDRKRDIEELGEYRLSVREYRDALADARAAFGNKNFERAESILKSKLGPDIALTSEQKKEVEALGSSIAREKVVSEYGKLIADGDAMVQAGSWAQAQEDYEKAQALLKSAQGDVLSPDERKEMEKEVEAKLTSLKDSQKYARLMIEAQDASKDKKKRQAELNALTAANKIDPFPPESNWARRMKTLTIEIALEKGREFKKKAHYKEARKQFEDVLRLDKDNADADRELKDLKKLEKSQSALAAAQKAFNAKDYTEALKKYTEAQNVKASPETAGKIRECKFQILLAEGDQLLVAKKYDSAIAKYEEARRVKSDAETVIDDREEKVEKIRDFEAAMAKGDDYLQKNNWTKAVNEYRKAKEISYSEKTRKQAEDAEAETLHRKYLTMGQEKMADGNYVGALADFRLAKNYKDTEEIKGLIKEAKRKADEQEEP